MKQSMEVTDTYIHSNAVCAAVCLFAYKNYCYCLVLSVITSLSFLLSFSAKCMKNDRVGDDSRLVKYCSKLSL